MRSRMTTFAVLLSLMLALPEFAHQAVGQEEGKSLLPPNFIATGDSVLVAYSIAPVTALPFSAAIEAENRSTDSEGHTTIQRYRTKIARDSHGRT